MVVSSEAEANMLGFVGFHDTWENTTHTHTHTHTHTYTHAHIYIYTQIYTHTHTIMRTCTQSNMMTTCALNSCVIHIATHCNTLQHTATHCNTLRSTRENYTHT